MAPMNLIDENDRRIFPRFYVFGQCITAIAIRSATA